MNWFMTELTVTDLAVSVDWYQRILGFEIEMTDEVRSFTLLRKGTDKLALKQGEPTTGPILHFQCDELINEIERFRRLGVSLKDEIKSSQEGYRRVTIADPDGRTIVVFEWTQSIRPLA